MRILFILLLIFQFNLLKADEINYLLKIPNLKTFSLNNENGIKYLIAKKNFKIGVQNNISCNKLEKKNLDNKFSLIKNSPDKAAIKGERVSIDKVFLVPIICSDFK